MIKLKENNIVKKSRLFLVFNGRFPSEKAASLFAAKSCEAFADEGVFVTLLVPRRLGRSLDNSYEYYHIRKNFKIVFLPVIDLFFVPFFDKISFYLSFLSFSVSSFFYLLFKSKKEDIIYSNEYLPLFFASFLPAGTFYEMHDFPESKLFFFKVFLNRMRWILVHNNWKMNKLIELFNINQKKFLYEPNAVDPDEFDISVTKEWARTKLKLDKNKKISVYTGHLYGWKGVDVLAEAIEYLPNDHLIIFIGGTKVDVETFRKKYGKNLNISILGHMPHDEIPLWQKAADVLVLPNTAKEKISKYYTSPMKLFEYMASKRPAVVTDIPSIREIANEDNTVIVTPDNPRALAEGILSIAEDDIKAQILTKNAFEYTKEHTWRKRANRIKSFFEKKSY